MRNSILQESMDVNVLFSAKGVSKRYNSGGESFQAVSNRERRLQER